MSSIKPPTSPVFDAPPASPGRTARSGEKYQTPQGFTAIKDGIRPRAGQTGAAQTGAVQTGAVQTGAAPTGKPRWLRAQIADGRRL